MSEPQNESETDAEPTPGPWRTWQAGEDPLINEECVLAEHPDKQEPLLVAEMNRTANDHTDFPGHWKANAGLIAAAGTAAQEAKDMGYDAQKAVEALPKILEALEDTAEMMDHPHAPGHAARRAKVHDALASAEGSGDE
jgi:hypothetical protein